MSNLRIVSDNVVDRATMIASSTSGMLVVANLLADDKSTVWRANSTSARLSGLMAAPESASCMHLPFCNLSPTATTRVRLTNEAPATNLLTGVSGKCEAWGSPPGSVRYVQAPDGTYDAVVPKPDQTSDRWQFDIPANTYANGTVLVMSWHEKVVTHTGTGGQAISPQSWVGANMGAVNSIASANGYARKWMTITITATAAIQNIRFYTPIVGADDIAAWGWQMEMGTAPTSYYPTLQTFVGRASTGTYIGVNGLVATAASGVARMNYHYPSLATVAPRLLVELAATNLATYSTQFDQSVWTKAVGSEGGSVPVVTADYAVSPDGAMTADRLVCSIPSTAILTYSLVTRNITGPAAGQYTISLWMKSNTGANQNVLIYGSTKGSVFVVTPQWQRFSHVDASASTSFPAVFGTRGGSGSYFQGGDANLDISIWGGQVEAGSAPTSDIYTGASTVTRAADNYASAPSTRPSGYIDWWQSYALDTGVVLACPAPARVPRGWSAAQAASAYANGGGAHARAYFAETSFLAFAVDIVDGSNLQAYIEASRIVIGSYWSPKYNADYGASLIWEDSSKHYRTDAGELKTDAGTRYRTMKLSLNYMPPGDRAALIKILAGSGMVWPVLLSLLPESEDLELERDHAIYGKLSRPSAMMISNYSAYSTSIDIEEV